MKGQHIPVLLTEAVTALQVQPGKWYIDATFGRGGHTKLIMQQGGKVVAFDHDQEAIEYGKKEFEQEVSKRTLMFVHENFDHMQEAQQYQKSFAGILFDFGINSVQLDSASRGFAFQYDALLDMRMDSRLGVTAKDLVNALGKHELHDMLTSYAQESRARKIADAIVKARANKPIETTQELAQIVEQATGDRGRGHIHPATKTFMALRMVVNDELGNIERVLPTALDLLEECGRIVTISFHEGEDRLVKHAMRTWEAESRGKQVTNKPLSPSPEEIRRNPRSRSAKLRVFEKGLSC